MKDGIIKGNGTSRYLKSVPNFLSLYPTYEDFAAALSTGTLPIDLNGLNPAGWTQQGTELNKAHLLSDAAVSALGLTGTDPTPNDAFTALPTDAMLRKIIDKQSARTPASGDYLGGNNGKISIANLLSYVKGQFIATGSYTGTGTYGSANPCSLTFPFSPQVFLLGDSGNHIDNTMLYWSIWFKGMSGFFVGSNTAVNTVTITGNKIEWYDASNRNVASAQRNTAEKSYSYLALG